MKIIPFQDACQGDSGGPYFTYTNDPLTGRMRAVIVGVVSRGNGCAQRNEPGKATKVHAFVQWIEGIVRRQGEG